MWRSGQKLQGKYPTWQIHVGFEYIERLDQSSVMARLRHVFPYLAVVAFLGLAARTSGATAESPQSERCIVSISEALSYLRFRGTHNTSFLVDACTNRLRTYSEYAAAKVYCTETEIRHGLLLLDRDCSKAGLERQPYESVAPILTDGYIRSLRVLEFREVSKGVELTEPILISRNYFWRAYRTNARFIQSSHPSFNC
jgi:hypothetical protein